MDEFRISNIARYPVVLSNSHSTSFTANGTVGSVSEGPLQNSRALSMTNMYMDITHPDIPSLSTNNFTIDWWENRNFAAETNSNGHGLVLLGFNTDQTYAFLVGYGYNTSSVGTGYTSYISSNGTSWNLASQIQGYILFPENVIDEAIKQNCKSVDLLTEKQMADICAVRRNNLAAAKRFMYSLEDLDLIITAVDRNPQSGFAKLRDAVRQIEFILNNQ